MTIELDASRMGWGATLRGQEPRTGGLWSAREQEMHRPGNRRYISIVWSCWQLSGNPNICQGEESHQYPSENRQHLSQGLHKSFQRNSFMANECSDSGDMEVMHRSPNPSDSRTPPRSGESSGRHGVTDGQGSL